MDDRYKKYVEYMWNSYNSIYNIKICICNITTNSNNYLRKKKC